MTHAKWLFLNLLLQACSTPRGTLTGGTASHLRELETDPSKAGATIYEGQVFDLESSSTTPAFHYERRVLELPDHTFEASHLTFGPDGHIVVLQTAHFDQAYQVKDFDVANAQTGTQVEVRVQGQQLRYGSLSGKHAEETVSDPVVVGPTLFGFIAAHWGSLVAGHPLAVRFVVTDSQTTYGFTLRHLETRATETEFVMEGAGLVSLAVKPQHFVFDSAKRRIIRYTGRVPPRRDTGGSLQDLDARVEYTHDAEYR